MIQTKSYAFAVSIVKTYQFLVEVKKEEEILKIVGSITKTLKSKLF